MPSKVRIERIEDRFRQDLSELLIREISDPRLHQIFITDVKVDRELAFADIYVSAVEGGTRSAEILEGLKAPVVSCVGSWQLVLTCVPCLACVFIGIPLPKTQTKSNDSWHH